MFNLHPHQTTMVEQARASLRRFNSTLITAPTGCGKTAIGTHITHSAVKKRSAVFFLVHRVELIDQTCQAFDFEGLDYGIIASGYEPNLYKPIQICSIDTLINRLDKTPFKPSLTIIDECHHSVSPTWKKVITHYKAAGAKIIGLSATPERLDGQGLGDIYEDMVCGPQVRWLMDNINPNNGLPYLSDYKIYGSQHHIDISGVKTSMGDYSKSDLEGVMGKPSIIGDVLQHYKTFASGEKFIGFAPTVKISEQWAEEFRKAGINCIHLDGKTDRHYRRAVMNDYKSGSLMGLMNVGLFGEGVDVPAASCLIDGAHSQSLAAVMQRWGRVLRPFAGKNFAKIIDPVGNYSRHGYPDDDRIWSLNSKKRNKQSGEKNIPSRQCGNCYHVHRPAPTCPQCGYIYPVKPREIIQIAGELQELSGERRKTRNAELLKTARTFPELLTLGIRWGVDNPEKWATDILAQRNNYRVQQIRSYYKNKGGKNG